MKHKVCDAQQKKAKSGSDTSYSIRERQNLIDLRIENTF